MLTWRKEPPDCDGVWAATDDPKVVQAVGKDFALRWQWYCRIGDVPQITEPVKYRPVTIDDIGRDCEFDGMDGYKVAGMTERFYPVLTNSPDATVAIVCHPNRCRIVDDGREPERYWVDKKHLQKTISLQNPEQGDWVIVRMG